MYLSPHRENEGVHVRVHHCWACVCVCVSLHYPLPVVAGVLSAAEKERETGEGEVRKEAMADAGKRGQWGKESGALHHQSLPSQPRGSDTAAAAPASQSQSQSHSHTKQPPKKHRTPAATMDQSVHQSWLHSLTKGV